MRHGFWTAISRVTITSMAATIVLAGFNGQLSAQTQTENNQKPTKEPVFRVSKLNDPNKKRSDDQPVAVKHAVPASPASTPIGNRVADSSALPGNRAMPGSASLPKLAPKKTPHPLDRAVEFANDSLQQMRSEVYDYTAIMQKREQVNGVIGQSSYITLKVRCPRELEDGTKTPFSIYMRFLKPNDAAGREVIWVDGQNDGNIAAHEGKGLMRFRRFNLDPSGFLAMRGQRYPIYDAGLENLIVKLIEKAERDRAAGPCHVDYRSNGELRKRPCTVIELVHNERRQPYEFHKAQVYIDDELNLPVRYAAYDWPQTPGGEPELLEEYSYFNIKVNVGLTDHDFSPANPAYKFPR